MSPEIVAVYSLIVSGIMAIVTEFIKKRLERRALTDTQQYDEGRSIRQEYKDELREKRAELAHVEEELEQIRQLYYESMANVKYLERVSQENTALKGEIDKRNTEIERLRQLYLECIGFKVKPKGDGNATE